MKQQLTNQWKNPFSYLKELTLLNYVGELNPTIIYQAIKKITNSSLNIDIGQIEKI